MAYPLISVAPMMDYTDRHCRYFMRVIAPDVQLYTEMITASAILKGDKDHLLQFDDKEHPLVLQLGGSEPDDLAAAARIGEDFGYDEINLNAGCPSPRVSKGRFGACLMLEPELTAKCIAAMSAVISIPVTVKCRIGVDHQDNYDELYAFIEKVKTAGCRSFIIHARKAWLKGLSPKENREVPPLHYETVWQIKKDFPELRIITNGGIKSLEDIDKQLLNVDGVMIGREACSNPYFLAEIQQKYFHHHTVLSRLEVLESMFPYIDSQIQKGVKLASISRHLLGLFQGQRGAAAWRRHLSQHAHCAGVGIEVIKQALYSSQLNAPPV